MRDYHKLRAFELADQLALAVYKCTNHFQTKRCLGLLPKFDELQCLHHRISLRAVQNRRRLITRDFWKLRMVQFAKLSINYRLPNVLVISIHNPPKTLLRLPMRQDVFLTDCFVP